MTAAPLTSLRSGMIALRGVRLVLPKPGGGHAMILNDADADFEGGRCIGILGHRGVGKSALIRLLGGNLAATSGTVTRGGSMSWTLSSQRPMMGMLSGRSNLRFIANLYRVEPPLLIERVRALTGIGELLDARVSELPRAMQARLSFATCLALRFDVYLADETLVTGDEEFRVRAKHMLDRLLREQRTLIVATRHPVVLRRHCDTGFLLHDGKLRRFENVEDAIDAFKSVDARDTARKTEQLETI